MVVSILGMQLNAVRSPPHEYAIRTRQQSVAHGLDVFGNTDVRCVQELKDAEAWDGAGHCEGDVSFGTRGTPDLRMSVGAEDKGGDERRCVGGSGGRDYCGAIIWERSEGQLFLRP